MRAFTTTVLSAIAVGVLLIAYGLLAPRASASPQVVYDPQTGVYHLARPMPANEQLVFPGYGGYRSTGELPPYATSIGYVQPAYSTPATSSPRVVETPVSSVPRAVQTSQRPVTRVDNPGRTWKKTAFVIGGSTATGAGVGGLVGGKKGALIGAAIGGGASTLYEASQAR
jgi:hypothetical protein